MKFSPRKKQLTIVGSILLILTIFVVLVNTILGYFVEKQINKTDSLFASQNYHISVGKVHPNIFLGNIYFFALKLSPDSLTRSKFEKGNAAIPMLFEIELAEFKLDGIKLVKALIKREIHLDKIILQRSNITIHKGIKSKQVATSSKAFSLDSIQINGIYGFVVPKFIIEQSNITIIDQHTSDTLLYSTNTKTELQGIELRLLPDSTHTFRLYLDKFCAIIHNEKLMMPGGNYMLSFEKLSLNSPNHDVLLEGLKVKPCNNNFAQFAKKLHYTTEMYTLDTEHIQLYNFDFTRSIKHKNCFIDSLNISGLNLSILKDKNYPFNTNKRPNLPNQVLKNMNFPLYVGAVTIKNSQLVYKEKISNIEDPMLVSLNNLDITINRLTSVKDSLALRKNMTLQLNTQFMNKAQLRADFVFPLYLATDTFFYAGSLGSASLPVFNKTTIPALGAQFTDGELQSIHFKGSANNTINSGEMTMLYTDLKAEVAKKDSKNKSKIISWAANTALLNSNPGNNDKIRVAQMNSERIPHKGFGNFMWKTLQNGITNTVLPMGNKEKIDNKDSRKKRKKGRGRK